MSSTNFRWIYFIEHTLIKLSNLKLSPHVLFHRTRVNIRLRALMISFVSWAFRHRSRALAALPLSLGLNPDGLTYRLAALLAKNPITHCLGDTSGAFLLRWGEPKSWAVAPLCRQREVIDIVTAHAVNSAGYQSIVMLWRWVIRVLSGRWVVGCITYRGLRPYGLTHG